MLQRNIEIGQRGFPTASQPAFGHTVDLGIDKQGDRIVALVRSYFGTTYVIGTQRGTYIIGVAADVGRRGRPVERIDRKVFKVGNSKAVLPHGRNGSGLPIVAGRIIIVSRIIVGIGKHTRPRQPPIGIERRAGENRVIVGIGNGSGIFPLERQHRRPVGIGPLGDGLVGKGRIKDQRSDGARLVGIGTVVILHKPCRTDGSAPKDRIDDTAVIFDIHAGAFAVLHVVDGDSRTVAAVGDNREVIEYAAIMEIHTAGFVRCGVVGNDRRDGRHIEVIGQRSRTAGRIIESQSAAVGSKIIDNHRVAYIAAAR